MKRTSCILIIGTLLIGDVIADRWVHYRPYHIRSRSPLLHRNQPPVKPTELTLAYKAHTREETFRGCAVNCQLVKSCKDRGERTYRQETFVLETGKLIAVMAPQSACPNKKLKSADDNTLIYGSVLRKNQMIRFFNVNYKNDHYREVRLTEKKKDDFESQTPKTP